MRILKIVRSAGIALLFGAGMFLATRAESQINRTQSAAGLTKSSLLAAKIANNPSTTVNSQFHTPTFLQDIQPILLGKCYRCHNQQTTFLNNWLDYNTAFEHRRELKRRVWDSWRGEYFKQPMPTANSPESEAITEEERVLIKQWVDGGATRGVALSRGDPHSKTERMELGKGLFTSICAACHQPTGYGIPNRFPPLAGSDFLNSDKQRAIRVVLNGLQGELTVNGQKFNNSMPLLPLSDAEIAAALTYVYNSFGNSGQDVTTEEVKALRGTGPALSPTGGNTANRPAEKSPWE